MTKRTFTVFIALCAIGLSGCNSTNLITESPHSSISNDISTAVEVTVPISAPTPSLPPFTIVGGNAWGDLQAEVIGNSVILNGKVSENAGFKFTTPLDTSLRNKTIILEIKNRERSNFNNNAMLKITINQEDKLIPLRNVSKLIYGQYVPDWEGEIEFVLPSEFDGVFGFTFAEGAQLNKLEIALFYRN